MLSSPANVAQYLSILEMIPQRVAGICLTSHLVNWLVKALGDRGREVEEVPQRHAASPVVPIDSIDDSLYLSVEKFHIGGGSSTVHTCTATKQHHHHAPPPKPSPKTLNLDLVNIPKSARYIIVSG